ncbi:MAG TPA: GPMC system MBL fold metallohydrolase [Desulfuromonadaceae bacterium]|jgi:phosphoribosyl 1,2-cyclic phosphate phosphodiesterase
MKFIILGSGTSTGVPMVGCKCRVCSSVDTRDKRTRASLLVSHNGKNILVDTSTDLRQQAIREEISRVDAVLFTHAHADHVNGIDDLRGFHFLHKEIIPCFASRTTLDILMTGFGYIFRHYEGSGYTPLLQSNEISGDFKLFGLNITPVPLQHGKTATLGYRIGNLAYLTDCSSIPETSRDLLKDLDVLILDGLRWSPHPFHFDIKKAIATAQQFNPRRLVLTHLTHEVAYAERSELPAGVEFAYDGMEFDQPDLY